ncbi:uncharacterized protein PHACADRAFT_59495, partial [Phanerochaete carnosa HHB-10118-sp]
KKMWKIFKETGIFVAACRHGFMLWIIDMMHSGELAKYLLAIISKILENLGDDIMIAYDIGCTTETTVSRSSLGLKFCHKRAKFCISAFHAYTHNHVCQMHYHPNNIDGMGIKDVESLERGFGGSNQLAPIIRYMS